ncbi:MAG TPA: hypothetical protein VFG50_06755 [Rhodothermales bacterium]|nr:hypothetical protein [Rhodothermales bacterium]
MERIAVGLLLVLGLAGCDMLGGGDASKDAVNFSVKFQMAQSEHASAALRTGAASLVAADSGLSIEGTNGTLTITDARVIVNKFKLKQSELSCAGADSLREGEHDDDTHGDDDSCATFQAPPSYIELPLSDGAVTVATDAVPTGMYTRFEFKVKDLDLDDVDDEGEIEPEHNKFVQLAQAVRAQFPEWPDDASMVVVGTFTPAAGDTVPFTTFIDAEVDVKMNMNPPLDVTAEGASRALTVEFDPTAWFKLLDGSVIDLSQYDASKTQDLLEFKVRMREGFHSFAVEDSHGREIERGDDHGGHGADDPAGDDHGGHGDDPAGDDSGGEG